MTRIHLHNNEFLLRYQSYILTSKIQILVIQNAQINHFMHKIEDK